MTGAGGSPRWWRDWTVLALLLLLAASFVVQLSWAAEDLAPDRFYDERHIFRNVRALVMDGRIRPPSSLYPSLSYLPYAPLIAASQALHDSTGNDELEIFRAENPRWVSKTGYFLARLVSVIAGSLCIGLTYVAGRRTISPPVGLLAAALLSVTWGFLLVTIKVKPDVLVMLFTLVTFLWSLGAVRRPSAGRYALAGAGVGLAAAAKYYGVFAALPLVVVALVTGGRRAVTWGRLALAGATSLATFFLLNPWPDLILKNVLFQREAYATRGAAAGTTRWGMLAQEAAWLLDENGAVVFVFLLLGCAGLLARATVRPAERPDRKGALALVTMVLGYLLVFALVTTYFTFQNFVPVDPFTSIVAAWAMVALAEGAFRRLPSPGRNVARALVWMPVAAGIFSIHFSRAYEVLVPTTAEVAQGHLDELEARRVRIVYQEPLPSGVTLVSGKRGPVILSTEAVPDAPRRVQRRADALVFPAGLLSEPAASPHSRFLASWEGPMLQVEPRWFAARGPALVLAFNEWETAGEPVVHPLGPRQDQYRLAIPQPLLRGELVSLAVRFHSPRKNLLPASLRLGRWGGEVPLYALPSGGRMSWMVTGKVRVRRPTGEIVFDLPDLPERVVPNTVELYRWRRGSRPAGADGAGVARANGSG